MKTRHIKIAILPLALFFAGACTDLSETIYDQVSSDNYYNTKFFTGQARNG